MIQRVIAAVVSNVAVMGHPVTAIKQRDGAVILDRSGAYILVRS